ncbi:patatin-like phospholipase family protein [Paenibacillus yanchengensis]|uniref:Patatin-like phospholipase family protein n=1 Tax=Paenibacillus yanchengensis TaxID=2035833 RepID=A0ABW4YIU7_9BACL
MLENNEQKLLLHSEMIEKLQQAGHRVEQYHYGRGNLILLQQTVSDRFYMIVSGSAAVYVEQGSQVRVELETLKKGQFFGEVSCLSNDPVTANVVALEELTAYAIDRNAVLMLMDEDSTFRQQMIDLLIKRIQKTNERIVEEFERSVLLMKQTEEQLADVELLGTSPAMEQLFTDLQQLATTDRHVSIIAESGCGKMSAARKLHYAATSSSYPLLVLYGDQFDHEEWNVKIRAARGGTLVVKFADQLPEYWQHYALQSGLETRIVYLSTKQVEFPGTVQLVIPPLRERTEDIALIAHHFALQEGALQADAAISPDALRILELYPFLSGNAHELRKIIREAYVLSEGRMITSRHLRFERFKQPGDKITIGLALGSGSLRGMAHLGVLNILEQEQIPIDIIAGTSVGSFVGGAYAAGLSAKECQNILATMNWGHLVKPTFPKRALVDNTPMIDFVEKKIGTYNIEDLRIPYAAVAAEVRTGEAHIMNKGSLANAICASCAIPSIMKPVYYENKTLVDGAVVHPVPAALVKSMGADIVIAVNVIEESFTRGLVRNFVDSITNTIDMMSAKIVREELQLANVILKPDLGVQFIRFKDMDRCITAGEKVTIDAMAHIKSLIQK